MIEGCECSKCVDELFGLNKESRNRMSGGMDERDNKIYNSDELRPNDRHAKVTAQGEEPYEEIPKTELELEKERADSLAARVKLLENDKNLIELQLKAQLKLNPFQNTTSRFDDKAPDAIKAAQDACDKMHGKEPRSEDRELEVTQALIVETCDEIKDMLLSKNKAYGNSALDPVRVFSRCSAQEQILVRIDDKLSRIQRGSSLGEDTVKDLIGYLVLLRVAEKMETK